MQYLTLGRTGVQVSELCLGTMTFGREADEDTSRAIFDRCFEAGINFIDCANVYAQGRSEEIVGNLLAECRDDIVLSSKVCGPMGEGVNARGLSRRHIMLAAEQSLRRLQTDYIDLYFCHQIDPQTPVDETLRALDDLVRQGKVLYPAVSNWAAWQIEQALGFSARAGIAAFECLQPMYNLVKRQAEVELLPMAQTEQLAVTPYSPLGGGLLTGKYGAAADSEQGRLTAQKNYATRYGLPEYYATAEKFANYAEACGLHPASLAIAWVKAHLGVTAPIIGARNLEQLDIALQALEIPMTQEWRDDISALSPEPPLATDRREEKSVLDENRR